MIDHNQILVLIDSIALFFQGFYLRRRHVPMLLISSLIMLFMFGFGIILNGAGVYTNGLSRVSINDATPAIVYVIFIWVFGYIIGGIQRGKDKENNKENTGSKCDIGDDKRGDN